MKIPFSPPFIDDTVIDEVVDCLKSGWITTGPKVKALEHEIADFTKTENVLCVNSWTSGTIMILKWLGLKSDDEVIVPAYTYAATALAVMHAGGKPVMVDSGDDFNISVDAIRKAISSKTKAIIPVDIAGWPSDYQEIMSLVDEPEIQKLFIPESDIQNQLGRILILNDAAHSMGAKVNNKNIGNEVDISIFSLHAVKNITTAEGGAICLNLPKTFNNSDVYKHLRMMSLNFQTKDAFTKNKANGWKYDIIGLGMKINLPDVNAAIGLAQIRQYDKLLSERRRVANRYNNYFSTKKWAIIPPYKSATKETSFHIYPLRISDINETKRDKMIEFISEKGIAVNVHYIPLPMLTFFKKKGYKIDDFPQSYKLYSQEISLPIYPTLTNEQIDYINESVELAYEKSSAL